MHYLSKAPSAELRGKIALLRTDFNIIGSKDSLRLAAALPTFRFLQKSGARIVVISHRGRPMRKVASASSPIRALRSETLGVAVPFLEKELKTSITFARHFDFKKIRADIEDAPPGSIALVENIRLLAGEEKNSAPLGKELASLGDFYVNDAFAVSHRSNASITQVPRYLPSYAGLLLEREMKMLGELSKKPKQPLVVVLGGAKASDKIGVLEHFLPRASAILLGGVPANTFLKARGFDIGRSAFERSMLAHARRLLKHKHIVLPIDFISDKGKLLDIGPETVRLFKERLAYAKTILWNGPMGLFENPRFSKGSSALARAVAESRAETIVGGGETTTLILGLKLDKKISFLSTGGGAMLEFLAGKKLPGIEALNL